MKLQFFKISCNGFFLILNVFTHFQTSMEANKELILTSKEYDLLNKFRAKMEHRITPEWLSGDLWLMRYLRGSNYDISVAEKRILETADWRRRNDMENILNETFTDISEDVPYYTDVKDKQGRPVWTIAVGEWGIFFDWVRIQGVGKRRVFRYIDRGFEELRVKIGQLQQNGSNATQASVIVSLNNFHVIFQTGCRQCIQLTTEYFGHQVHYRYLFEKIILINTPSVFETLMRVFRLIMAPETDKALRIYGKNKREWQKEVLSYIDANELYHEVGGRKFHN